MLKSLLIEQFTVSALKRARLLVYSAGFCLSAKKHKGNNPTDQMANKNAKNEKFQAHVFALWQSSTCAFPIDYVRALLDDSAWQRRTPPQPSCLRPCWFSVGDKGTTPLHTPLRLPTAGFQMVHCQNTPERILDELASKINLLYPFVVPSLVEPCSKASTSP